MATEKEQQQVYSALQTNGHTTKQSEESPDTMQSKELKRKKRNKCLVKFAIFTLIKIAVTLFSALYIMKIRTPKFRVQSATFDGTFDVVSKTTENASFNITMNAELGIKNPNFGPYKYRNSTVYFFYNGVNIGEAFVFQGKAGFKSTKKFNVFVNLSSKNVRDSQLRNKLSSGTLTVTCKSKLEGKVELFVITKKRKSIEMSCTITIGLADKAIRNIDCT